jgi:hypothetical protein
MMQTISLTVLPTNPIYPTFVSTTVSVDLLALIGSIWLQIHAKKPLCV